MMRRISFKTCTPKQFAIFGGFVLLSTWVVVFSVSKPVPDVNNKHFAYKVLLHVLGYPKSYAEKFKLKLTNVIVHTPNTYPRDKLGEPKSIRLLCWITTFHSTVNFKVHA